MRKWVSAMVGLVLLVWLLAALGSARASLATFTVNTTDDTDDGVCDTDHCSLREAISAANSTPYSAIEFNISTKDPGYEVSGIEGTWTISLTSDLPSLSGGNTTIDGSTQAGNHGDLNQFGPEIEVAGAGMINWCFDLASDTNVIHGLVMNRCAWGGTYIHGNRNVVSGNYIGTDALGSSDLGGMYHGVVLLDGAKDNFIGGDTSRERNVISANDYFGVIMVDSGTDRNTVSGNYIGTDRGGGSGLGNHLDGVMVRDGAQSNIIGGDTPGEGNLISGNEENGVSISESGTMSNTVSGNYIGTKADGSSALPNGDDGVVINLGAQNNLIGGHSPGERNVISGNEMAGVMIYGSQTDGNRVSGNYVGTDADGVAPLPNGIEGVRIWYGSFNVVGGDAPGEGNVISGNDLYGVHITSGGTMSNTVSGNYIGTDAGGSVDLGNGDKGVFIHFGPQFTVVGGATESQRNIISGNHSDGVHIAGLDADNNTVSGNYIGTDALGLSDLANDRYGVQISNGAQSNVIGGGTSAQRNVISGHVTGVFIFGGQTATNTVSCNYIGTDSTGAAPLANTVGVRIRDGAHDNTVGPGNVIAYNDLDGVVVDNPATTGNTITQDSIHSNGQKGIALTDGGNGGMLAPSVTTADPSLVQGTAGAGQSVEIFTGLDEEGRTYLTTTSADGSGNWSAVGPFSLDLFVTATATDSGGNTSEFSMKVCSACTEVFLPLIVKNY